MMKKHSIERGSASGPSLASGKTCLAYGMTRCRKASKMICCAAASSVLTSTSFVQQPTARGAQPPDRLAASSAAARICAAASVEKHGTTCTVSLTASLPSKRSAYGTEAGSSTRWAHVPFGRLMIRAVGVERATSEGASLRAESVPPIPPTLLLLRDWQHFGSSERKGGIGVTAVLVVDVVAVSLGGTT